MDLRRWSGLWLLLSLSALPLFSVAAGKCERLVVTGSPDAPPYLWQDPQERYDIFMNNYTERTWTMVSISAAIKDLMKT